MKTTIYIKNIFVWLILFISLNGCNYLNVSDDLASELTLSEVFNNSGYARRFQRGVYSSIPNSSFIILDNSYAACDGLGNPWPTSCDELQAGHNNTRDLQSAGYHSGSASLTRWQLYKSIRQANIFLKEAHVIHSDKDVLDEKELKSLKAETRFLRAYYHYLLFELYGAIPIMAEISNPSDTHLDFSRNSIDEVVTFLDTEFKEVAEELNESEPDERNTAPTKAVALALRAKTWLYAASPLFNGGYAEAVSLKDHTGKQLFPENDKTKWQKALDVTQDFITYAEGRFSLYKKFKADGTLDPDASLYELFINYNNEIIWASTKDSWGSVDDDGTQRRCTPRGVDGSAGMSSVGVTQELIDAFLMKDGLNINESPLYDKTEKGFTNVTQEITQFGEKKTVTDEISNMYLNREPRFYQTVMYSGRRWHVSGEQVFFYKGSKDDNSSTNNCWTGYLLYKRLDRTLYSKGSYPRSRFRPSILFRLAEFYLQYAEVLNEVNPSDTRIIEYVDKVRERAGIPLLKDIKFGIIGNKELQREAIRQERRLELCTEGQRYFDVRRWMIAENTDPQAGGQSGNFHGMNMNGDLSSFYTRTPFVKRLFERRMYLYPIPLNEIQNSKTLVQNPGW